jgi:ParB-like chromosome segregation protein Spo0J|tara:strand:+ start:152 stop:793 length:642 start_codon:yes stop_codon:yes gene_type:complete
VLQRLDIYLVIGLKTSFQYRDINMQIEHLQVAELVPFINNSRTHSDEQVAQVAASIKEFGFTNPILIGSDNVIIAGHGRLLAARKLGTETVPCIRLAHLSEAQRRAYVIADNKLALNAGWDDELLSLELGELENMDFDLSLIGFSEYELGALLNSNDLDYSDKNKELDLDDFNDEMQMKFNLSKEQYDFISDRLSNINDSKEIALLSILNYEP